jgi:phenylalanyl-tRNA synthetase alpha chain
MIHKIKEHIAAVEAFNSKSHEEVEQFRIKYLGKKGLLNDFFAEFKNVPNEQKKEFGLTINELKTKATEKVTSLKTPLKSDDEIKGVYGDLTRPGEPLELGSRHPISVVKNKIIDIFSRIGFNVSEGPEIEDDWHNFKDLKL